MPKRTREERNSGYYDEKAERMGVAERAAFGEKEALKIFHYAYESAPGYKKFLDENGVGGGAVKHIGDFSKLPVLKKNKMPEFHQNNPPFGGLLAVPVEKLKRIYVSPGPIYDPEGRKEDYWGLRKCVYNVGFRPGDIVMNTFSYHLTPAGIFLDEACNGIGCVTVPTGIGNTEIQAKTMAALNINGYIGIPSFLISLIKKMEELGYDTAKDLAMEIALVAGEILSPSLRKGLNDYGILVRQAYITADLGGVAYECPEECGMHISDDLYLEICDPITGESLPAGSIGEVVVTDFSNECYPLIRYGTGDLSAVDDGRCACGRTSHKLKGIMGRADEVTKIKGMFVHPRQVDEAAARFPGEVEKIRLVVTREGVTDIMTAEVELKKGVAESAQLGISLEEQIRESTKLRGKAIFVKEIPAGSKKIDDRRSWK
jgi:phenylacetate-CoA ligase